MDAPLRATALTAVALVAFAANSLLTRAALDLTRIDPVSFTAVRLVSGAILLWALARGRAGRADRRGSWGSALALFGYALLFSLAYRGLTAATGALLLFGAVQVTMLLAAAARGDRPGVQQWVGLAAGACRVGHAAVARSGGAACRTGESHAAGRRRLGGVHAACGRTR